MSERSPDARKFQTVRPMLHAVVGIDPLMLLAYTALGALSRGNRPATEGSRPA